LGSGPVSLGTPVDWHRDFKTGFDWPLAYAKRIDYLNRERASDVKVPWELSRLQWLIPVAQAYLLNREERCAAAARDLLMEWIGSNPCAVGINWAVTMEVALRIVTWTFLFHVFNGSSSWSDRSFRLAFLRTLFMHADYAERNLERADVNGNHLDADAVGLVLGCV